jgi:cytochrome c peroxidase
VFAVLPLASIGAGAGRADPRVRLPRLAALITTLAHALLVSACDGAGDAGETKPHAAPPSSASALLTESVAEMVDAAKPVERLDGAAPPPSHLRFALTPAAVAGKELFFDKALSASNTMSCATCHDPDHAYGPPNELAVQLGGPKLRSPGLRAVPSLRYKEYTPGYMDLLDNPDGVSTPAPGGGFAWDGRADSLAEQAKAPLLSPFEMANASGADIVAAVRASPSAEAFVKAFGPRIFDDPRGAFEAVTLALQSFQNEDSSFHPYTSKFDLHVDGKPEAEFTPAERRGQKVFDDPRRGNCAGCHFDGPGISDGSSGMFTDYSFEGIGVPRNPEIPANRDPRYFDVGICGPIRTDRQQPKDGGPSTFCGLFKTPTLRNAATRHAFFHNGAIHSLEQAVRFYNTRDTSPELWYPTAGGKVQKYNDLPAVYRKNLDDQMPLDGRAPGSATPMTEAEVADLICFIETLTDDWRPGMIADRCLK